MSTTRELLLQRLAVVLATVPEIQHVFRNQKQIDNDKRPGIVLLDGDETVQVQSVKNGRGGPSITPTLNTMRPEIYLLLKEGRVLNVDIGTKLNDFRDLICHAIVTDTTIKTLLGSNGSLSYGGCTTDLKSGSAISGQMRIDFSLTYLFIPM